MMIRRTELILDHRCPLKEMADRQFLRDANTAMCLDGALANKLCRARNLRLASRYRRHAFGSGQIKLKRRHGGHGFRLLNFHEHVDHPVLKHLEAGNWLTELVTLARIFERALMQLSGHTAGFCADCNSCFV